jgi:arylformamidase
MPRILDISPIISPRLQVWPGDVPFERAISLSVAGGDPVGLSSIRATLHLGAHADAPNHLIANGAGASDLPLDRFYGPCEVVRVKVAPGALIRPSDLPTASLAPRVLFRTDTFPDPERWNDDFGAFSPELVEMLADRGVLLAGIDTPSVDPFDSTGLPCHRALLRRGLVHLEGLVLTKVEPGRYTLVALPLAIEGGDAAPLRAALVDDLRESQGEPSGSI